MNIQFSDEMRVAMRSPAVRFAAVRENTNLGVGGCENCGGIGYMHLFLGTGGPFEYGPGMGKIGHWDGAHWWEGSTRAFICPVCKNATQPKRTEPEPRLPYPD